jgi:hypothetical protein
MMIAALTLATVLTGATPAPAVEPIPPRTERTPNLYRPPGPDCRDIERRVVEDQQEQLRKLGRLPRAYAEYAVLRQMQGCPVAAPVGYHPPALPGAADTPAMRGDAPSNRR